MNIEVMYFNQNIKPSLMIMKLVIKILLKYVKKYVESPISTLLLIDLKSKILMQTTMD